MAGQPRAGLADRIERGPDKADSALRVAVDSDRAEDLAGPAAAALSSN